MLGKTPMSAAVADTKTSASPERLIALSELLLSTTVLDNVVPKRLYKSQYLFPSYLRLL